MALLGTGILNNYHMQRGHEHAVEGFGLWLSEHI